MIKRMEFASYPKKLQFLDLSANMIDLMPTVDTVTDAAKLQYLYGIALLLPFCVADPVLTQRFELFRNLSQNMLWSLNTNSELLPYTGLLQLYVKASHSAYPSMAQTTHRLRSFLQ